MGFTHCRVSGSNNGRYRVGSSWASKSSGRGLFLSRPLGVDEFLACRFGRLDNSKELEARHGAERCFLASALLADRGHVSVRDVVREHPAWYLSGAQVLCSCENEGWPSACMVSIARVFSIAGLSCGLDDLQFHTAGFPLCIPHESCQARFRWQPFLRLLISIGPIPHLSQDHDPRSLASTYTSYLRDNPFIHQKETKGTHVLDGLPALLLLSMVISIKGGVGSNNRARYSEFLALPLLCVGIGPIAFLWSYPKGLIRVLGRGVVLCFLLASATASVDFARANYPHHWSVPLSLLDTVNRIERENDNSRSGHYRIQPPYSSLQLYAGEDYVPFWTLRYHSMWRENIRRVHDLKQLQERFDAAKGKTHFLLLTRELISIVPRNSIMLAKTDAYELWEETGP